MKVEIQNNGAVDVWTVRKPKGREIFQISAIDENNPDQLYNGVTKMLSKLIVKSPDGLSGSQINFDELDDDILLELYFAATQTTIKAAKKFQTL